MRSQDIAAIRAACVLAHKESVRGYAILEKDTIRLADLLLAISHTEHDIKINSPFGRQLTIEYYHKDRYHSYCHYNLDIDDVEEQTDDVLNFFGFLLSPLKIIK